MKTTPDTPLATYFVEVFQPARLVGKNRRYVDTYSRAIEWLAMTLDRQPLVRDLMADNIRRTMRTVADAGNRFFWIEKMRTRLCSLWKHAQRLKIVDNYQRVTMADFNDAGQRYLESPPPGQSLSGYYMAVYRRKLKGSTRQDVDAAVRSIDKSAGRYVMLEEITDDSLVDFGRWLAKQRRSAPRIERYQAAIRGIVRAWDPERFPLRGRGAQEPLPLPAEGTLRWLFATTYVSQRMLDATEGAVYQGHLVMRRLHAHYGRDITLAELDDALVTDHFAWLKRDQRLRATSINSIHRATILAVWRFAVDQGLKDRDPRNRKLKELRHEPDSWDVADVGKLVDATRTFAGRPWPGVVPLDAFWRALLLVEWWTGLRIGSLLQIQQDHVSLQTGWLYVPPQSAKNAHGKKYRLGDDAVAALKGIWRPRRELLFAWPYQRRMVWRHFRQLQQAAGLPDSQLANSRFHKMRRTVATQAAISSGLPAAIALLDHSGREVTRRYLDPSKMPGSDATEYLPQLTLGK